ncbi:hypothetical protein [Clostridium sartagoforme]|uniref:hypothetical protein n=1 Tax=Clostridium sartagoforme TaxID=84031 RepID=UPI00058B1A5D|nr:hypothetical protein [Clostridium sartagoforme]
MPLKLKFLSFFIIELDVSSIKSIDFSKVFFKFVKEFAISIEALGNSLVINSITSVSIIG